MMNTIMEEKIKQAFQEWKQTDKPKENEMSNNRQLSNVLMNKIKDNPGITGKELRAYVTQTFPHTPVSYVPALLKGFHDKNVVSREAVLPTNGGMGRSTFAYTFVPEGERPKAPKKTRTAKKAKPVHKEDKGITTLIPTEHKPVHPLDVGTTTLHITISTSNAAYTLRLEEAKFIYQQLNQIFGGVR